LHVIFDFTLQIPDKSTKRSQKTTLGRHSLRMIRTTPG
jgi:hypothetical protein